MQAKEVVLGKSTGRLPVRPPSRGERGVASVVSTSRHCHLGGSTDTISAHFPDVCAQRRAMMPKLFGQLRAFLFCGDERTCRPQTHVHRILNTEWQATRAQLANCKGVLSLYLPAFYRRALRVLGNRDASEDASRRRCWLPTNICTNSGGSRRCPLG